MSSNAGKEALAARTSKQSKSSVRALARKAPGPKKKKGTIDYALQKELANYRKAAEKKKNDAKYASVTATARRVIERMKEKEKKEREEKRKAKERKEKQKKEKVAKRAKQMRDKYAKKKTPAKKNDVAKPPCKDPKPVAVSASARAQRHCRKKPFGG